MSFDSSSSTQMFHTPEGVEIKVLRSHDHPILTETFRTENRGNPSNKERYDPKMLQSGVTKNKRTFKISSEKLDTSGEMYSVAGNHQPRYESFEPSKSNGIKLKITKDAQDQNINDFEYDVDREAFGKFIFGKHVVPPSRVPKKTVQRYRGRGDERGWSRPEGISGMYQGGWGLIKNTTSVRDPTGGLY